VSSQTALSAFSRPGPDDDVGEWRLATDEPGFYGRRHYWRTDDRVLVANQNTGSFSVYDLETWESGILGRGNEPLARERDLDDVFAAAVDWMLADSEGPRPHPHAGGGER
jgi:hypothetical protein